MKLMKLPAFLMAMSLCFSLAGCGIIRNKCNEDNRYGRSKHSVRDAIISALDNQDEAALKSLFSDETIAQVDDLDEKIAEYVAFYKGTSTSYDSKSGSESGIGRDSFDHWYEITTDEGEYVIYFDYIARDELYEKENHGDLGDKLGLHAIVILTKELADQLVYNPWPPSDGAFILYTPKDTGWEEYQ